MIISGILITLSGLQAIGLFIYMVYVAKKGSRGPYSKSLPDVHEMKKHIVWKVLYVNPDDPRGWVPKTSGYGVTVNFRNSKSALIFAVMVVDCLLLAVVGLLAAYYGL